MRVTVQYLKWDVKINTRAIGKINVRSGFVQREATVIARNACKRMIYSKSLFPTRTIKC